MQHIPISVTILVKNSQRYLKQVLTSLISFNEVIVLDNGSTDRSLKIAAQFENVVIKQHDFIGFGAMKNLAAEYASNDWIFNLDSDEILTNSIVNEIAKLQLNQENIVYQILRLNHYRGKLIKACGQYPDYVNRIYNKTHTRFTDKLVHESIIINKDTQIRQLQNNFLHYSFNSASDLINKIQHYSSLYAKEHRFKKTSSFSKALSRGVFTFMRNYLFKSGFIYGKEGFILAVANAQGVYYKYLKLAEANADLTVSLIITTYNRVDALEAVLNSIKYQERKPNEVIIADDGSTEETRQLIKKYQTILSMPLIHSWQEDQGFRLARSRNLAIKKSTCDYLIVIDGDMVMHPKFIADHLKYAKLGRFIQGGRIILSAEKTADILKKPEQYPQLKIYSRGLDKRLEKRILSLHIPILTKLFIQPLHGEHKGIRGCNMSFFRQDALAVNGFNNQFIGWGREDSEFIARLYNNKVHRINLRFAAIAYHLWHQEADRASLPENDQLLETAMSKQIIYIEDGIQQLTDDIIDNITEKD